MSFIILLGECEKDGSTKLAILKDNQPIIAKSGSPQEMAQVLADQTQKLQLGSQKIEYQDGQYWSQSKEKQKECKKVEESTQTLLKRTIARVHHHQLV